MLSVSLMVDGVVQVPTACAWSKDGTAIQGATSTTLAITTLADLDAEYSCKVTFDGYVQSGSIDLHAAYDAHMNSVCRTQRVYYRSASAAVSLSAPTTWVTESGNVYGQWTAKVPPLAASTDSGLDQYPYLYTCTQSQTYAQRAAGAGCTPSDVLLDEGVTVIPGSLLVKGSVSTEELAADAVTADKIAANSITIGALSDDVTDVLDGMGDAIADATEARYDNTWDLANGTYTFTAHAYRGAVDITDELPDEFFTWYLRNESGESYQGTGKQYAIAASNAGWRPSVVGCLEDWIECGLLHDAGAIVDSEGDGIVACWVV